MKKCQSAFFHPENQENAKHFLDPAKSSILLGRTERSEQKTSGFGQGGARFSL
jgi:hypothetical protein